MHVVPVERQFEIDEPSDLAIAESLLASGRANDRRIDLPRPIGGVCFDFDGVFTDNRVFVSEDGREHVVCSRTDGLGIAMLRRAGVPVAVFSTEVNPVVAARCRKLAIEFCQGLDNKAAALRGWAAARRIPLSSVLYLGNDDNDLECMQLVGCAVAVADAQPRALPAACFTLSSHGGLHGAVRELCELVLGSLNTR